MVSVLDDIEMKPCPICGKLKSDFEIGDQHGCTGRKPKENILANTRYFHAVVDGAYEILEIHAERGFTLPVVEAKGRIMWRRIPTPKGNMVYSSGGMCYGLLKDFNINGKWLNEISVVPKGVE